MAQLHNTEIITDKKNTEKSNEIKFVWNKLLKYKPQLWIIAITGILYGVSKALIAHFVKQLMDSATIPENLPHLAIAGIVLAFTISLSRYFHIFLMNMVSERVTQDIRYDLQNKFLRLNLKFHNNYTSGSGGLLSRTFNDVKFLQDGLRLFADLFTAPVIFIAVLFNLFYFDYRLALGVLIITPIILTLLRKVSKKIKSSSILGVQQLEKITSTIKESLDGVRTIQAFNLEAFFQKKLHFQGEEYISIKRKIFSRVESIGPMNEFVATILIVGIFYYFSTRIASGHSSYGVMMAYLTTIMQANEPIKKFQEAIVRLQEARVCADRIDKLLQEDSEIHDSPNTVAFPQNFKEITYKNIGFSYVDDNSKPFISNFNLTIKRGQTIAFVGESGSGKTTLANLLARFYDPQAGEILVDQVNIKNVKLHELRKHIGLVSQDVFLFSDTVQANIIASQDYPLHTPLETSTHTKLLSSAKAAHAAQFIERQPLQYETLISEKGSNFSGGEKQRLAIARALYKDAPILILDEATSALDSVSEEQVQQGLNELMQGRTTLVIAHRLSTIQNADLILVMEKGEIKETGTHQELLAKNGLYAKLYYTQNRG